ncbi:MAG: hypothetical protein ABIN99_02740, partial [Nitrosospira sp.]
LDGAECVVFGVQARRNDAEWCDPAAGCGRHETRSQHPLRWLILASRGPSCDTRGRLIPRSCMLPCAAKTAQYAL